MIQLWLVIASRLEAIARMEAISSRVLALANFALLRMLQKYAKVDSGGSAKTPSIPKLQTQDLTPMLDVRACGQTPQDKRQRARYQK